MYGFLEVGTSRTACTSNVVIDTDLLGTGNPASDYISNREFNLLGNSASNIRLANSWIKQCVAGHDLCEKQNETHLPTRLLDVGSLGNEVLKLYTTSSHESSCYAALSYCWGDFRLSLTTLENLNARHHKIEYSCLSKTIQDAVEITRKLNIRYLWIDSICIIQDSKEDKNRELPRMASIYKGAYVTIIAAATTNASEGFLTPKSGPKIELRLKYGSSDEGGLILLRDKFQLDHNIDQHLDPTETRAWCLQESTLSPRCLVYSSFHIYWGCRQLRYADSEVEFAQSPLPDTVHHYVQKLPQVFFAGRRGQSLLDSDREELWTFWVETVYEYSHRKISFLEDRFDAISALVTEFHNINDDQYLAGIWRQEMWRGLLWFVDPSGSSCHASYYSRSKMTFAILPRLLISTHPQISVAPSWSWLSVGGEVYHLSFTKFPKSHYFEFIDAEVTLDNPNLPFSRVTSGSLKLKGRMEHAVWRKTILASNMGPHFLRRSDDSGIPRGGSVLDRAWSNSGSRSAWEAHHQEWSNRDPFGFGGSMSRPASASTAGRHMQGLNRVSLGPHSQQLSYSFDANQSPGLREAEGFPDAWEGSGIEDRQQVQQVFCLEIAGGSPDTGKSAGLILLPASETERGTFKRIGCFVCDTDRWFVGAQPEVIKLI